MLKTRPPISVILLALINLLILVDSIFNPVWIIYLVPFDIIFYIMFCRYCCTLTMNDQVINVRYFNPWKKNIEIDISVIAKVEYRKGLYDLFSNKRRLHSIQYCYDELMIHFKNPHNPGAQININTMAFGFDKVLKKAISLKLLDQL